jgi:hypothetical protein
MHCWVCLPKEELLCGPQGPPICFPSPERAKKAAIRRVQQSVSGPNHASPDTHTPASSPCPNLVSREEFFSSSHIVLCIIFINNEMLMHVPLLHTIYFLQFLTKNWHELWWPQTDQSSPSKARVMCKRLRNNDKGKVTEHRDGVDVSLNTNCGHSVSTVLHGVMNLPFNTQLFLSRLWKAIDLKYSKEVCHRVGHLCYPHPPFHGRCCEAKLAVVWDMASLIQVPLIIPILLEAKMTCYH